jgi:GGDEF domain-containing protein
LLKGLEEHNRLVGRHMRAQTAELQNMVRMLASTVGIISAAGRTSHGVLAEIEKQVVTVSGLDDVRLMKSKLADCLADIRKEAIRQREETSETIERLNLGLNQARERCTNAGNGEVRDPVTGLLMRSDAEASIARAGRAGTGGHLVVLVLDRLKVLNQRFGREVGDEILTAFARMVQTHLEPEDQLFRWGGPALLALLPRPVSFERIRGEIGHVLESRLEHTVQTPSRSILIPIAARWTLFPVMMAPRLVYQKIDAFAANPDSRD